MKSKLHFSSLVFAIIVTIGCNSQTITSGKKNSILTKTSASIINPFFTSIKNGNYNNALRELLSTNVDINLKDSSTVNLENKFNTINKYSGKFISERLLRKKEVGNDLGVYVYFVCYAKKFYRFTFTFYNNGNEIKIYKFSFDDSFDSELEDGMRLYTN
ncbi:MAG TPA: hypothetical protein VL053_13285 [Arachidicoccus sp.]|nr:hypothetical protein [Arachidicoccus sp.]